MIDEKMCFRKVRCLSESNPTNFSHLFSNLFIFKTRQGPFVVFSRGERKNEQD